MVTPRRLGRPVAPGAFDRDATTLDLLRDDDRFVLELIDDRRNVDDIAALASLTLAALAPILDRLVTAGAIALDGLDDAPTRRISPVIPEEVPISFDIAWTDESPAPRASQVPTLPSIFDSWDTPSQRTTVPGSPKFDEPSNP